MIIFTVKNKEVIMKRTSYFEKGKTLFNKGEYKKALINFMNALKEHSDWPDVRNYLGLTYNMLSDLKESVKHFKKAIELNNDYVEAHLNLALTYNEMGLLEKASDEFNIAAELERELGRSGFGIKQKLIKLHVDLGNLYYEIGNYENALNEYKNADKISSDFPDIKLLIGKTYMKMNKMSGAIIYFNRAIKLNPNLKELFLQRGLAYYKKDKYDKAKNDWELLINENTKYKSKAKQYMNLLNEKSRKET